MPPTPFLGPWPGHVFLGEGPSCGLKQHRDSSWQGSMSLSVPSGITRPCQGHYAESWLAGYSNMPLPPQATSHQPRTHGQVGVRVCRTWEMGVGGIGDRTGKCLRGFLGGNYPKDPLDTVHMGEVGQKSQLFSHRTPLFWPHLPVQSPKIMPRSQVPGKNPKARQAGACGFRYHMGGVYRVRAPTGRGTM